MTAKRDKFVSERAIFVEHIKRSGLRRTMQRELIMETFLGTEEHLTIEGLHSLVKKADPTVGHTTVYRTLRLLTEAGLAREVRFGDNKTYFEHHYNHAHHDHMICTVCGRVIEFVSEEIEKLQDQTAADFGFTPTHHSLRLWGICSKCKDVSTGLPSAPSGAQPRVRVKTSGGR